MKLLSLISLLLLAVIGQAQTGTVEVRNIVRYIGTPSNPNNFRGFIVAGQPNGGGQYRSFDLGDIVASKIDSVSLNPTGDSTRYWKGGIIWKTIKGGVGATGATGAQGPQGIQGIQGPQGPAGSGGGSALSLTTTPADNATYNSSTGALNIPPTPTINQSYSDQWFEIYQGKVFPIGGRTSPTGSLGPGLSTSNVTVAVTGGTDGSFTISMVVTNAISRTAGQTFIQASFGQAFPTTPTVVKDPVSDAAVTLTSIRLTKTVNGISFVASTSITINPGTYTWEVQAKPQPMNNY